MINEITSCLTWYANKVAETVQYTTWSDDFCRKQVKRATDAMLEELKKYIDWEHITVEEAQALGFRKWCENYRPVYLMPLYLLPILPIGTKLVSIFDEEIIYDGANIDNDNRGGLLAFGLRL